METVRELSKPGQVLAPKAATATMNNPDWWYEGAPTPERDQLHRRLLAEAREAAPKVEQNRRAIVLAGPPGAGKTTVLADVLRGNRDKYLVIDADEFKRSLLREAQADGSYASWLKPEPVREREARGERFFPLELASLVHEESSYLAKSLRDDAIAAGDNIVIDTVLSDADKAVDLGNALGGAGYDVKVINVEVPFEVSEARIRERWLRSYTEALEGGDSLGGRWVPSEYAKDVFDSPDGRSKSETAALAMAEQSPSVSRYRRYFTSAAQETEAKNIGQPAKPQLLKDLSRAKGIDGLVDTAHLRAIPPQTFAATAHRKANKKDQGRDIF